MRLKYMILVAAALLMMIGCTAPKGGNDAGKPVTERRVKASRAKAEIDTTALTYEHGIPVDLYSVDDGIVEEGDYFSVLMEKLGVGQSTANELIEASRKVFDVKNIRVGNHYHAYYAPDTTGDDNLTYFVYDRDRSSVVVFALQDSLRVYIDEEESETKLHYNEVTINSSLWYDTQKAGCTPLLAIKLSDIYAWTIDFFGLQKGDSYKAVYETQECAGKVLEVTKVYYASFTHAGKEYQAYYFDEGKGKGNKYWNEKGEGSRKAFLKAPLKFSRISSGFSYARRHPVTRREQPHTGVDYAAPKGTPVVSIGDGVVTRVGYAGAGGNTVHIKHDRVYRTAYLHLSRYGKGIRPGVHVTQGQVIGYVGSTGRSTGPHLDFRIWENEKPVNPLKMITPPAEPISKENMPAFEKAKARAFEVRDSLQVVEFYRRSVLEPLGDK